MISSFHRRFWVLLVSAAAGFGVWKAVPGTDVDRSAFTAVARGFANPPLLVAGQGTHAAPWTLRTFSAESKVDPQQAALVVSLGDDLDGVFQARPPAPIDFAVIFSNFKRLGAKKAASALLLAWETPDPVGLAALEKSLRGFDSLVMAAPLTRSAVASAMPPAFRRASISLDAIHGDPAALPVVNRIPVPGVIFGDAATAGFSVLESESPAGAYPLLARWEDRVLFAFPLLTVLQRLNLPTDGVEIQLGEYLKLSPGGPIVPIDDYGRLGGPLKPLAGYAEISAEALIDGGDDLFPKQAPEPVILRDDRNAAEPATAAFSRNLSAMIAAIASDAGLVEARGYRRLAEHWELGILAALVIALTVLCGATNFGWCLGVIILVGICVAAQWIAFGAEAWWLPGLPSLAVILAAFGVSLVIGRKIPKPPLSPQAPELEISPDPEPVIQAAVSPRSPAKKTATPKGSRPKKAPSKF